MSNEKKCDSAFDLGVKAGVSGFFTAPIFSTMEERMSFRAGWMESMKNRRNLGRYDVWWAQEGSAMRPFPGEDMEEFARRITEIAWSNGEDVARQDCAKVASDKIKHRIERGFAAHGHAEAVKKAIMKRGA